MNRDMIYSSAVFDISTVAVCEGISVLKKYEKLFPFEYIVAPHMAHGIEPNNWAWQ